MTHLEFANSLRLIADFYEKNGDMKLPFIDLTDWNIYNISKEDLPQAIRTLARGGKVEKKVTESAYTFVRKFGQMRLGIYISRGDLCEITGYEKKIVTHTKNVNPPIYQEVTEEIDVPIWKCPESVLAEEDTNA